MNTKKMIQMINEYMLFYNQKRTIKVLNYSSPLLFVAKQLNNQKNKQI
ncbi:MAG: hypothetical protein WJU30_00112 [Candidatus Phytoplasma pruni]